MKYGVQVPYLVYDMKMLPLNYALWTRSIPRTKRRRTRIFSSGDSQTPLASPKKLAIVSVLVLGTWYLVLLELSLLRSTYKALFYFFTTTFPTDVRDDE